MYLKIENNVLFIAFLSRYTESARSFHSDIVLDDLTTNENEVNPLHQITIYTEFYAFVLVGLCVEWVQFFQFILFDCNFFQEYIKQFLTICRFDYARTVPYWFNSTCCWYERVGLMNVKK